VPLNKANTIIKESLHVHTAKTDFAVLTITVRAIFTYSGLFFCNFGRFQILFAMCNYFLCSLVNILFFNTF
jgi:hypothetical protein